MKIQEMSQGFLATLWEGVRAHVMLDIYSQTLETNFSPESWETQGVTLVKRILGTNGGAWFWHNFEHNYPENFRNEVNRILGENQ